MNKNISIITDLDGSKFVLIRDIRFKGKTRSEWDQVEKYLKEYIGNCYEIAEYSEKVYIGTDFPDEFTRGKDKTKLRGPNLKAKANASCAIGELIEIATNQSHSPNYERKHDAKAKYGGYRYDTRLALPIYDNFGSVDRYNIYRFRMLVRHDQNGKRYLYDLLRTKKEKETNSPL